MTQAVEHQGIESYISRFEEIERRSATGPGAWLLPIRKAAMARFCDRGFPTTKQEEWRFTNVAPIARAEFAIAPRGNAGVSPADLSPFLFGPRGGHRIVFVNGHFDPALSMLDALPRGVSLVNLGKALADETPPLQAHLTRHADYRSEAFPDLNTALMSDGAFLHVAKGAVIETPIQLVFVSAALEKSLVTHPRVLIVAEDSSQVTIVESYVGRSREPYFTNAVTELVAGENAVIDHYKVGRESDGSFHVGLTHIHQHANSNVSSFAVTMGGGLTRNDITTVLDGEGCNCALNGFYMSGSGQHVDNHLIVDHAKPHCDSREFFKGVLDGRGRGVFSGKIIVREGAQKTDAKQSNMSLLLSEDAQVDSKPQLEIFADDVKCTHGVTVGQVSDDAVFYLRSRGLDEKSARGLLVYGFAHESIACIRPDPLRKQLTELLFERLPHGRLFKEAG